jgi:hypothetical protein
LILLGTNKKTSWSEIATLVVLKEMLESHEKVFGGFATNKKI